VEHGKLRLREALLIDHLLVDLLEPSCAPKGVERDEGRPQQLVVGGNKPVSGCHEANVTAVGDGT